MLETCFSHREVKRATTCQNLMLSSNFFFIESIGCFIERCLIRCEVYQHFEHVFSHSAELWRVEKNFQTFAFSLSSKKFCFITFNCDDVHKRSSKSRKANNQKFFSSKHPAAPAFAFLRRQAADKPWLKIPFPCLKFSSSFLCLLSQGCESCQSCSASCDSNGSLPNILHSEYDKRQRHLITSLIRL